MAILNAVPAHVALLNSAGVILVVNEAWRRYASANVLQTEDFLEGRLSEFTLEYPCCSGATTTGAAAALLGWCLL